MDITQIIAEALAKCDGIEAIDCGYRLSKPEGTTTLTFQPVIQPADDALPVTMATVETRFARNAMGNHDVMSLMKLNRRAVFGSFFRDEGGVGCRMTWPLFDGARHQYLAPDHLLQALQFQLAIGVAIEGLETGNARAAAVRAGFPQEWRVPIPESVFATMENDLTRHGYVAVAGPTDVVLKLPLSQNRSCEEPDAEAAGLRVSAGIRHPLVGTGYLATMVLPINPTRTAAAICCDWLNAKEHDLSQDFPRIGAWGLRGAGRDAVYGMFWPSSHGDEIHLRSIANAMMARAWYISDYLWDPGFGIHIPDLPNL